MAYLESTNADILTSKQIVWNFENRRIKIFIDVSLLVFSVLRGMIRYAKRDLRAHWDKIYVF